MSKSDSNKKYRNRLRELAIALLGGQCIECDEDEHILLHFHHIDPSTKTASIACIIRTHPAMLFDELAKCVLLCEKCHKKVHKVKNFIPEKYKK